MSRGAVALALGLLLPGLAVAQSAPPQMGRHQPLHPGTYLHGHWLQAPGDRVYDASGQRRDSIAPQSGDSRFPTTALQLDVEWHFPLFESVGLPVLSTRTHRARLGLRQARASTRGDLAGIAADRGLETDGSGFGDIELAFGSFLVGGGDWRTRGTVPRALLIEFSLGVPTGVYERDAPHSVGRNSWRQGIDLGGLLRPWSGGLIEAGVGYRRYSRNHEPLFGALAPAQRGEEWHYDLSLTQRLRPGLHVALLARGLQGAPNTYDNPRFAPNPPPGDSHPVPGRYRDAGTRGHEAGLALYAFPAQRWRFGVHLLQPYAGRSGEFDLPHETRSPAGCIPGAALCTVRPGETVRVDGLGPARRAASAQYGLSLTYQFGLGDPFPCPGCTR